MLFTLICITLLWAVNPILLSGNNDIKKENLTPDSPETVTGSREQTWDELMNVLKPGNPFGSGFFNLTDVISTVEISPGCRESLQRWATSLSAWEPWAVRMADASGGLPSGLLGGRVSSFGSFDQCLAIQEEHFRGQYCLLALRTPLLADVYDQGAYARRNDDYEDTYGKPPEWVADFVDGCGAYLKRMLFFLGTCVPSACPGEDVGALYARVSNPYGFEVTVHDCQVEEQIVWSIQDIAAMSFLALVAVLCFLGTASDVAGRHLYGDQHDTQLKSPLLRWLRVFSVPASAAQLLPAGDRRLGCLDGLRVLSFVWILVNHQAAVYSEMKLAIYRNFLYMTDGRRGDIRAVIIDGAHIAVETFFCISGFLLVVSTWKKLEKSTGRFNILKFMFQKYLRLTPSLALTISLFMLMYKLGSGPIWKTCAGPMYDACQTSWWKNFLYISNWFDGRKCLGHTWFLGALMQSHLIGVILLCIVYRWPMKGILLSSTIVVGTISYIAWVSILKNYPLPKLFHLKDFNLSVDLMNDFHSRTYVHLNSYIFGMAFGYMYLKHRKDFQIKFKLLGWLLTACSAVYVVYGKYCLPGNRAIVLFYHVSHRAIWATCLGWLIYTCCSYQGGAVNRFLSWRGFAVLSKISYPAYLLHVLLIVGTNYSKREAITFGDFEMALEVLGLTTATFILSVLAYVAVELPFGTLTGRLFDSTRKKRS